MLFKQIFSDVYHISSDVLIHTHTNTHIHRGSKFLAIKYISGGKEVTNHKSTKKATGAK